MPVHKTEFKMAAFLFFALFLPSTVLAQNEIGVGPLPIRNQQPVQLFFIHLPADRAEVVPFETAAFDMTFIQTNTLLEEQREGYKSRLDTEITWMNFQAVCGLSDRVEGGIDIPFIYMSRGFMDGTIKEFEERVDSVRLVRERSPSNGFHYQVYDGENLIISGDEGRLAVGDITPRFKVVVLQEGLWWPTVGVRGGVKIPTGNRHDAFGSGKTDASICILLQKNFPRDVLYLNSDVAFPGQAFAQHGIELREYYSGVIAWEHRFFPAISTVIQAYGITRPFQETGLEMLDRRILELAGGVNITPMENLNIQVGFIEDCLDSSRAASDFSVLLNVNVLM